MVSVNILCVGKVKEKYIRDGIDEFLKRLTAYAKVSVVELKEESKEENSNLTVKKESENIIANLKKLGGYNILLDISGKNVSSPELAKKLEEVMLYNSSTINFIIGGSHGVSDEVRRESNWRLSFSKMTFPHQLMRLILLEQIYRGYGILNNNKYHK